MEEGAMEQAAPGVDEAQEPAPEVDEVQAPAPEVDEVVEAEGPAAPAQQPTVGAAAQGVAPANETLTPPAAAA